MFHESLKQFWKNNHFENMRASFLRRCQSSLWQTSHEMMHFQAWKKYCRKMAIYEYKFSLFFLTKLQKTVIALDLIQYLKSWPSQNDHQILSFVKAINVVGKKWPETVLKCPTPRVVRFISDQSLVCVCFPVATYYLLWRKYLWKATKSSISHN